MGIKKEEIISARVGKELKDKVEEMANKINMTVSEFMRLLLEALLKDWGEEKIIKRVGKEKGKKLKEEKSWWDEFLEELGF